MEKNKEKEVQSNIGFDDCCEFSDWLDFDYFCDFCGEDGEIVSVKFDEEICDLVYEIKNKGEGIELYTERELYDSDVYRKRK